VLSEERLHAISAVHVQIIGASLAARCWLGSLGVLDFAGGTVVHIHADVAVLVLCVVLGPRSGYPKAQMPPNSLVLTVVGASMLWVGWFSFNAGS
jgi:Amt family ammonium transporter